MEMLTDAPMCASERAARRAWYVAQASGELMRESRELISAEGWSERASELRRRAEERREEAKRWRRVADARASEAMAR